MVLKQNIKISCIVQDKFGVSTGIYRIGGCVKERAVAEKLYE